MYHIKTVTNRILPVFPATILTHHYKYLGYSGKSFYCFHFRDMRAAGRAVQYNAQIPQGLSGIGRIQKQLGSFQHYIMLLFTSGHRNM